MANINNWIPKDSQNKILTSPVPPYIMPINFPKCTVTNPIQFNNPSHQHKRTSIHISTKGHFLYQRQALQIHKQISHRKQSHPTPFNLPPDVVVYLHSSSSKTSMKKNSSPSSLLSPVTLVSHPPSTHHSKEPFSAHQNAKLE